MNDINEMPPVCAYCPYWEVCKPPYICASREDKKPKRTEKRTETHASDCISRQALCEYALNQKDKSITANDIMRFPSAQPERKRGKWRHYEGYLTCSECRTEYDDDIMTHCCDDVPKFCPNCGADMREGGKK